MTVLVNGLTLTLTQRQLCDVECLLNGAFSPLHGFLEKEDYEAVCHTMRLQDGTLFPVPITLDIPESFAKTLQLHDKITLTAPDNTPIAILNITSMWQPNKQEEAELVFGTCNEKHPGVYYLYHQAHDWYVGGRLTAINLPHHADFTAFRHTPEALKAQFKLLGWDKIIAFQTRNPMHRAHFELTLRAATEVGAHLLIHPVVGMTKPDDVDYITRVKCYIEILKRYPNLGVQLSLLPLAIRMAGPREAVWHAIIRKNYGATHFIIGRDHAGLGPDFYEPYAAQTLLLKHGEEIGIVPVHYPAVVFDKNRQHFVTINEVEDTSAIQELSGTELRKHLAQGLPIPEWFTFPEISAILSETYPSRSKQGVTFLFTGLSGAGKSTLALALKARLQETTTRSVTLLDGDILRKHLSNELGFSQSDRNTHLERVAYVASEITKHRGIAIIAAIAPYQKTREFMQSLISEQGRFIEIHVATPLETCKSRDVKGLYEKAERGEISEFTGISAPYETPERPNLTLDTTDLTISKAVDLIMELYDGR